MIYYYRSVRRIISMHDITSNNNIQRLEITTVCNISIRNQWIDRINQIILRTVQEMEIMQLQIYNT